LAGCCPNQDSGSRPSRLGTRGLVWQTPHHGGQQALIRRQPRRAEQAQREWICRPGVPGTAVQLKPCLQRAVQL